MKIPAQAHTDDHAAEVRFDARRWFVQASDDEVIALAKTGYGGDDASDAVAEFMRDKLEAMQDLFAYLHARNKAARDKIGFECHVDQEAAEAWLREHRPRLAQKLGLLANESDLREVLDTALHNLEANLTLLRKHRDTLLHDDVIGKPGLVEAADRLNDYVYDHLLEVGVIDAEDAHLTREARNAYQTLTTPEKPA